METLSLYPARYRSRFCNAAAYPINHRTLRLALSPLSANPVRFR